MNVHARPSTIPWVSPPHDDPPQHRVLRAFGWTLTILWAGVISLGFIGAGLDPAYDTSPLTGVMLAVVIGLLPVTPFWWRWISAARKRRARREEEVRARTESADRDRILKTAWEDREQLERLPREVRDEWRRLREAHRLVVGFAEQGWVARDAIAEVGPRVDRLRELLLADRATNELGGRTSVSLRAQVGELTRLLVALADDAVERQAVEGASDELPATLRDAQERLAAERQAYLEVNVPTAALDELQERLDQGRQRGT